MEPSVLLPGKRVLAHVLVLHFSTPKSGLLVFCICVPTLLDCSQRLAQGTWRSVDEGMRVRTMETKLSPDWADWEIHEAPKEDLVNQLLLQPLVAIEDEKDKDPWVMAILDGEEVMVTIEDKAADGGEAMLALEDKGADGEAMLALEDIPEVDRPQPDGTSAGDGWNLMEFQ